MNKKTLAVIIGAIVAVILVGANIFMIIADKNRESATTGLDGDKPLQQVEDVKENITENNFSESIENNEDILSNFNITRSEEGGFIRFDHRKLRPNSSITIEGISKVNSTDYFSGNFTSGINNAPDFGFTFNTTTLSDKEVESIAYDIISDMVGSEITDIIKGSEYNEPIFVEVKDTEKYQDIIITKDKSTIDILVDDTLGENSEQSGENSEQSGENSEQSGENSEGLETIKSVSYTYGVKYIPYEDNIVDTYEFSGNDKKLFQYIPIIKLSGDTDLSTGYPAFWVSDAQGTDIVNIAGYSYRHSDSEDSCELNIETKVDGGETLRTNFYCVYNNETGMVDYTFDTMTKFCESKDSALESAINIINKFTGESLTVDDFTLSEGSLGDTYSYVAIDGEEVKDIVTITVSHEFDLGYYAYVETM